MKAVVALTTVIVGAVAVVGQLPGARSLDQAATACMPQTAHGPSVGTVQRSTGEVYQGKNFLTDGAGLLTNGTLCTGDGSQIRFLVKPSKPTTCEMRSNTRLRLYPPKKPAHRQALIRFEAGRTYCGTGKDPTENEKKYDTRKGQTRLLMKDPLFAVDVDPTRTLVKVKLGYINVSRTSGGRAVIIGPDQQVSVPELADPEKVGRLTETADDKAGFAALQAVVPKPDFGRPAPGASVALKRIIANTEIVVGLDSTVTPAGSAFVKRFYGLLARSWNLNLALQASSSIKALDIEKIDVLITKRNLRAVARVDALPLFADSQGGLWSFVILKDDAFRTALSRFVQAAVGGGTYSSFYRASFKKEEPSFDQLQPTLFA